MVTQFTDAAPYYGGEALVYEANPSYSRDLITIATAAGVVPPCTVLGKITASGKYVPVAPAAGDGSQNAAAVSIHQVDATAGDMPTGAWTRDVTLNGSELGYNGANGGQITTINAALKALGIIVRAAG